MSYQVPALPYGFAALEPHIDARTMEIHHDCHHAGYVNKLNKALEGHAELAQKSVEDLLLAINAVPEAIRQTVINNGGGHANHSLFWTVMSPDGGGEPSGELANAIQEQFGDFASFKEKFSQTAVSQFGSGWGWLVVGSNGSLSIYSTPNQNSPLLQGDTPVLGVDIWEHAYYLKYQNKRAEYVQNWWNTVNWEEVKQRFTQSK